MKNYLDWSLMHNIQIQAFHETTSYCGYLLLWVYPGQIYTNEQFHNTFSMMSECFLTSLTFWFFRLFCASRLSAGDVLFIASLFTRSRSRKLSSKMHDSDSCLISNSSEQLESDDPGDVENGGPDNRNVELQRNLQRDRWHITLGPHSNFRNHPLL
jgi:hypothetical protein